MADVASSYVPDRGDVVWIDFDPQAGHEQAFRRPALVLSRGNYNGRVGLAVVCPITRRRKGYPYELAVPPGLSVSGFVLADQVKNFDWKARNAEFLCRVPRTFVDQVVQLLNTLLDATP